ncbi:MAG TPA: hypothetical protein VGE39_10175 [Prosthecobacter sp.]
MPPSSRLLTRRQWLGHATCAGVAGGMMLRGTAKDGVVEIPPQTMPAYLESYRDPAFGSRVTRITGEPGSRIRNVGGKWAEVARHRYSKIPAWNADQSLLLLGRHDGLPGGLFLDGSTYEPLFGQARSPGTEETWHPKKPEVMFFTKDDLLGEWQVRTDAIKILATFPGYSGLHFGPWEGNFSRDGGRVVLTGKCKKSPVAFAYDLASGKKWPDIWLKGTEVDWVSISPSGRYVVLNGAVSSKRGDQTQVYDLEGSKIGPLWEEYGRPSHYDMSFDSEGEEVAVGVSKSKPDDGRVISRRLRDGRVTVLTSGGYASHASARNVGLPGWAFVTYQHSGPDWEPYWNEVVMVKLDGSQKVRRIAQLRTELTDYLTESHAVPSPDGRRVLWCSNWGAASGRPIASFVAEVPPLD